MRRYLILMVVIISLLLSVVYPVFADQEVTFVFDRSPQDVVGDTTVTEYFLYRSPVSGSYDMTIGTEIATVPADGSLTYTVTVSLPDGYSFVLATAHGPDGESEPSNEVRCFCRTGTERKVNPALAPPPGMTISQ